MLHRSKHFFYFLLFLTPLSGCIVQSSEERTGVIVCSTSIVASSVREVVGNRIQVISLMGPGIDPHNYNPRPKDVELLDKAEIIVYSGFHLEGKMAELFHRLRETKPVYAISENFPKKAIIYADAEIVDPHIWFDTKNWLMGVRGVIEKISLRHPEYKNEFVVRMDAFENELLKKTEDLKRKLRTIPRKQRVLITSHDAFHYFGKCFDVQVSALQGVSTAQEPSISQVLKIVEFISENKINAIFIENSVSPKALHAVLAAVRRKGHQVRIGGTLYSDALGGKDSGANTYSQLIDYNVTTIYNGLKNENMH